MAECVAERATTLLRRSRSTRGGSGKTNMLLISEDGVQQDIPREHYLL